MPAQSSPSCSHDIGPGITVCLRCRQAERQAARARQQRVLGAGAAVVVVAALLGSAAVGAARGVRHAPDAAAPAAVQQGEVVLPANEQPAATPAVATPAPAAAIPTSPAPVIAGSGNGLPSLVIAEGHTALQDGLAVDRTGGEAVVSFDTPATRTRRRDKVEQVVRATLPVLYGPSVSAALAKIPDGAMSQGDLLTDVVPTGIRIPLATGAIALSLETRPGQDGPLVVRYRARVVAR